MLDPRPFISAFLIAVLLPGSSLAAFCETNCRSEAIHTHELSSSMDPSHAAHQHHHHHLATPASNSGGSQGPHHHSVGHQCCDGKGFKISSACLMRHDSILQEQKAPPKSQPRIAALQMLISDVGEAREHPSQHTPDKLVVGLIEARVLPLRI